MTTATVQLTIFADESEIPGDGVPVKTVAGCAGRLVLGDGDPRLLTTLYDGDLTEQRWALWQLLSRVRGVIGAGKICLRRVGDIDDDTLTSLALDLHNATDGGCTLPDEPALADVVARVGEAEDRYRRWVDEDPTVRTSLQIAKDVTAFARATEGVTAEVLDETQLQAERCHLLCAVGGASRVSPPRLVCASWDPPGATGAPLMLVGKGVTFDTGGVNTKPYESFVSMMKNDMGGAALAWALFRALVEAQHPERLVVAIPTCENPVGEDAMRPGSIVTGHRGISVRIDHTDAEGRLILADALSWGSERFAPHKILTFATLTTAALNSYGPYATPVHFADAALQSALQQASGRTGEDLHFFPGRVWHREANRDKEADLRNTARLPGNAVRAAGSRNAAHFLRFFSDIPLVHTDIFASTWNWGGDAPGAGYGATGAPLRTFLAAMSA
ncbi:MAG: leucyl aminopeptidase family protein [Myxococcales bacterium]|nr:leucyl aminopeptidase family protein [Myxococcales bacterium]